VTEAPAKEEAVYLAPTQHAPVVVRWG